MPPPSKVCIVKLGAIGDVVNSLPLLHRLRAGWPRTRITWVIAPLAHQLIEGIAAVDEFLVLDPGKPTSLPGFLRELRKNRFDLVVDLQRILKSALVTRLSGAARRLGFDRARCKEGSWIFTNEHIAPNESPGVTVAQYLEFADHLGLPPTEPEWNLPLVPWTGPRPAACLNIGASKSANLWPAANWAELARGLAERYGPERVVLCGGSQDRPVADLVMSQAPAGLVDTVGQLSLKQSAGLIAASDVFVGCDTGPMHVAVATGTPLVTLFGAADPQRTGPFGRPEAVVWRPADCSPCRQRACTVEGHPCMTGIDVDLVLQRVLGLQPGGGLEAPTAATRGGQGEGQSCAKR